MTNITLAPSIAADTIPLTLDTRVAVTIKSPTGGGIVGGTFPITGTVSVDPVGRGTKATVTVSIGTQSLPDISVDGPEGEADWSTTATIGTSGTYKITTIGKSGTVTSDPFSINVTVDTLAPTVTVTAPVNGLLWPVPE